MSCIVSAPPRFVRSACVWREIFEEVSALGVGAAQSYGRRRRHVGVGGRQWRDFLTGIAWIGRAPLSEGSCWGAEYGRPSHTRATSSKQLAGPLRMTALSPSCGCLHTSCQASLSSRNALSSGRPQLRFGCLVDVPDVAPNSSVSDLVCFQDWSLAIRPLSQGCSSPRGYDRHCSACLPLRTLIPI